MLPFHRHTNGRQPSKTIETNGCLTPKPSKNHWTQWLSLTIPFNGDGAFQNHWNFAMVAKCGPKSPKSFDYAFGLQEGLETLKWAGGFLYPLFPIIRCVSENMSWLSRLQTSMFRSFNGIKAIGGHWSLPSTFCNQVPSSDDLNISDL